LDHNAEHGKIGEDEPYKVGDRIPGIGEIAGHARADHHNDAMVVEQQLKEGLERREN
jgi:hypothetical protein